MTVTPNFEGKLEFILIPEPQLNYIFVRVTRTTYGKQTAAFLFIIKVLQYVNHEIFALDLKMNYESPNYGVRISDIEKLFKTFVTYY